jgi:O-antigen/teichoic acid export membrane protein
MRNLGFMGASTAVRLALGLLTFGIMARALGPAGFGQVMTALAISVLAGLVANFGLSTYVLREMGAAAQDEARRIMSEVLTAKLCLVLGLALAAVIVLPWVPARWQPLLALMLLAQVFDAVTDLLNVGFRATGRYAAETRIATASALVQCGLVAGALLLWPTPLAAAAAYCVARGLVLVMTGLGQRSYFAGLKAAPWRLGLARLRAARSYAMDFGLQALFGQVDSVVLAATFGTAAVGAYQAGMRLFLGGAQAASVLGNVAIPKLSSLRAKGLPTAHTVARVQLAFLIVGSVGGLLLALVPADWVTYALGDEYQGLVTLLPWFGLLFLVRLTAASWGLLLTVEGRQGSRAIATLFHWLLIAAVALYILPEAHVAGWLIALTVGNAALALAHIAILYRINTQSVRNASALVSLASGAVLLAIAIHRT